MRPIMLTDIKKVVDANPDAVNPRMFRYFYEDGSPCCVFGHVFASLGSKAEEFEEPDYNSEGVAGAFFKPYFASEEARRLAICLQEAADNSLPWREAWVDAWDKAFYEESDDD